MTIAFDNAAVNSIAAGDNVTLEATVKESTPEISDAALVIEVKLSGATFSDGKAKVSVPFSQTVPEGKVVKVYFINGDQRQDMNAILADGKVVFETNHFSTYAVVFEDASSSDGNGGGFPIWVIAVIAVVVLAAAGGAFFFMQKKKA
jgi:flagellar basal body-associated protein FliL